MKYLSKEKVIQILEDIRSTCFDDEVGEINPETVTAIDEYCEKIEKGKKI